MSQEFNDELISAYLDGELTAEQQALVERKLKESPEHQQMRSELSVLRDSFQALPSYKLDEGFGRRVLRAAEREMLTSSDNSETAAGSGASSDDSPIPASVLPDSRPKWRLAVGSVAAVAAMLLITLFLANQDNEDDANRNVASQENVVEKEEEVADNNGAPSEISLAPVAGEGSKTDADMQDVTAGGSVAGGKSLAGRNASAPQIGEKQSVQEQEQRAAPPEQPRLANESRLRRSSATAIPEKKDFGAAVETPELVDRSQSAGRRANQLSEGGFSGGGNMKQGPGFMEGGFDFVVFLDVPKNQLAARPVEEVLRKRNVTEDFGESRHRGVNRAASDEFQQSQLASRAGNGAAAPQPKKKPAEDKESELKGVSGFAAHANDLLVVATFGQIKEVCTDLKERGITATPLVREVNADETGSFSRLRQQRVQQLFQAVPNKDGVELKSADSPGIVESKQEESDRTRALSLQRPNDGIKPTASKASPPKPAPAAPPTAPAQDNKDKNLVDPKSGDTVPADARETAKRRRAITPQEADEDAKRKDDSANSRGPAAGRNATVEKANEQRSRDLADKPRTDEAGHSFFRQLGRADQFADRKESAEKSESADDSPVAEQQPLAKEAITRDPQALSAAADSVSLDGAKEQADPSKWVRVRFIIRPVDPSPVSSSAAEEPKSK